MFPGAMQPHYTVDPADPRAPSQEIWDALTAEERAAVVASLPASVPLELHPPEGDDHREAKNRATDALTRFIRKTGRRIYVSNELATYYPGEPVFCPDVLAVHDVPSHRRSRWVVADEGKGLDLVIEVHDLAKEEKDFVFNVQRYARLGISEYFLLDVRRGRLLGYRLPTGARTYQRLVPQGGLLTSQVLGLDLALEGQGIRFYYGAAPLPEADELIARLDGMLTDLIQKRDAEALAREEAEARLDEAARAREEAEARLDEAARAREEAEALLDAEALARKEAEARVGAEALARKEAEARVGAEALARKEAEARVGAEALARKEAEALLEASRLATSDVELRLEAESRARRDAEAALAALRAQLEALERKRGS
jgi:Uma2 family endonuclease